MDFWEASTDLDFYHDGREILSIEFEDECRWKEEVAGLELEGLE